MLDTPVALLVFNRVETTRRVLDRIRVARPRQLFVVADGPRADRPEDVERCAAVRVLIEDGIDWPCDVRRDYAEQNLGCARRVVSGLNWVFSVAEEAIVLEDDCVPEPTFFPFCAELLARYRHEPRVGVISGSNHQYREFPIEESYYFSVYNHVWGWASWRRAWQHYDHEMRGWPGYRSSKRLEEWLGGRTGTAAYWRGIFDRTGGFVTVWDYRWTFACWQAGFLSVLPRRPLIQNIGFDAEATHTRQVPEELRAVMTVPMEFPLKHPKSVEVRAEADAHTESILFRRPHWVRRWLRRLRGSFAGRHS